MNQNQDKTICCRVDTNLHELLVALTDHKKVKLSSFIRDTLEAAVTTELRRLNIINSSDVTEALNKQTQELKTKTQEN